MATRTERIKEILKGKGLTYSDLAREIGVTQQAIHQIVTGATSGKTARYAVAAALGCEVSDLWPDEQEAVA